MKTKHIVLISLAIFLVLSIFGSIRSCQVKKLAAEKSKLQTEFNALKKDKEDLKAQFVIMQVDFNALQGQKTALEIKLREYTTETNKTIEGFKKTIREYKKLSSDTVYLYIFSKWPTFDQVLKFRFAENQIREMYLNVLERDHYLSLYEKSNKSLLICTDLNLKNNDIIGNLTGQNTNLQAQVDISDIQIGNLQDNLKLSYMQVNKQERKTFFYKLTTVAATTGLVIFAIK